MSEPSQWAAPWTAVVVGAVAALGLGAWAVAATDPPGRLLVGLAALAVLAVTAVGALARPRLRVDDAGLALRGVTGTRRWPWEHIDAVRVVRMRRMGLPAAYLEVEARDGAPDAEPDRPAARARPARARHRPGGRRRVAAAPPRPRGTPGGGPARARG